MPKEKILIIVESPKKVDTILKYAPDDKDYIVLASYGHIADLSKTGKYHLGIDVDDKFKPHYILDPNKKERLAAIINACTVCDKVLMATDGDREGECIASLIKDRIKTTKKPVKRIVFDEITKEKIKQQINNEREIDENLVNSAKARRALDRIVGYMGSPFIIKRLGSNMSAGRVQSVALKLVVEREKEIQNFKPEEYWIIKANLLKFAEEPFMASLYTKDDIKTKEEAEAIKAELEESSYKITKVTAKPKKRNPFPPLTTSRLQQLASSRFRLSPAKTMSAAQHLYESGTITYMRTDSVRLSNEALDMVRGWIKENYPSCLPDKPNFYKNKNSAQNAHEAIRPSNVNSLPNNNPTTDIDKVYRVIWDSFVTCQMTPAIYDTTSVVITTNQKKELRASGRVLKEPGWLVITNIADEDDEKENKLPILIVDDVLTLVEPKITTEQKFTQPPPRYKEATLVRELETNEIGRPSTYAAIMQKICETRNFVEKKNEVLHPTESGTKVVELLDKYFSFMKYGYTAEMEKKLDLIEQGEYSYVKAMSEFFDPFKKELDAAYKEYECDTDYTCNKCGSGMILKKSSFGYFLGCSAYPDCKTIMECEVDGDKIVVKEKKKEFAPEDVSCPKCNAKMVLRNGKFGEYYACSDYPNCFGNRKKPYGKKCPTCGKELFRTVFTRPPMQGAVLCCTGYPSCDYVEKLDEPDYAEKLKEARHEIYKNTKPFKTYKIE